MKKFPVKIQTPEQGDDVTMLFKNVSLTKPAASLFDPPAGFKKYDNIAAVDAAGNDETHGRRHGHAPALIASSGQTFVCNGFPSRRDNRSSDRHFRTSCTISASFCAFAHDRVNRISKRKSRLLQPSAATSREVLRFCQRLVQFAGVLAAAAGVVRLPAAFAADDRRDLLDDFSGLNFRREIRRDGGDQRNHAVRHAAEDNHAFEPAFQRVGDGLQEVAIGGTEIVNDRGHAVDGLDFFEQVAGGIGGFALLRNLGCFSIAF